MGKIRIYPPVKIFCAVTFAPGARPEEIIHKLEALLSPADSRSALFAFSDFTDYYSPEMGSGLQKQFVSFTELKPAEYLPDLKIAANSIETDFAGENGRTVNIDPGYLCAAKIVLATTKDYDHRIYLNRGIFGDVHLRFRKGHFQLNDWTYPDYRRPETIDYFEALRNIYLDALKDWKPDQARF